MTTTKQVTSHEVIGTLSDSELDAVSGGGWADPFQLPSATGGSVVQVFETFGKALAKVGQT